jgi:uncharacterized membrane protein
MYRKLSPNILLLTITLVFLAITTFAYADIIAPEETPTLILDTATTAEKMQEGRVSVPERESEHQDLRQENQNTLNNTKQVRITNLAANISNRTDAAIERFTKISTRLETRIEKLKLTGIDTTEAEQKLDTAKKTLSQARTNINTIDTLVYNATTSPTPREDWKNVKETFRATGKLIRQNHQELREVILSLKWAMIHGEAPKIEKVETPPTGETPETINGRPFISL